MLNNHIHLVATIQNGAHIEISITTGSSTGQPRLRPCRTCFHLTIHRILLQSPFLPYTTQHITWRHFKTQHPCILYYVINYFYNSWLTVNTRDASAPHCTPWTGDCRPGCTVGYAHSGLCPTSRSEALGQLSLSASTQRLAWKADRNERAGFCIFDLRTVSWAQK